VVTGLPVGMRRALLITSTPPAAPRSRSSTPRGGLIAGSTGALHTLDFPVLVAAPALRTLVIVALCVGGLAFSLTGVVIGWRRLRM